MAEADFRPEEILRVLQKHDVRYVLIGGFAAAIHGSPIATTDVDVTPDRSAPNLDRLSAALRDLDARIRVAGEPEGVPFSHTPRSLGESGVWNLTTKWGDLDLSMVPSGTFGYDDLKRDAILLEIHDVEVPVASLADVIRSKEAAGREKDRLALPILRRLLEG